jgi:hypothetical protein
VIREQSEVRDGAQGRGRSSWWVPNYIAVRNTRLMIYEILNEV